MSDRAEPQRAATMRYMHGWNIFATSGAHILGIEPDGRLQATVVCWKSPGGAKGVGTSVCGALSYISKDFDGTHKPLPLYMKSRKLIDKRLNALIRLQKSMKQEHAAGPHLYISAVAVDPSVQGTKLGSKLMAAVAAMADADGLPCYTEVSGSRATFTPIWGTRRRRSIRWRSRAMRRSTRRLASCTRWCARQRAHSR